MFLRFIFDYTALTIAKIVPQRSSHSGKNSIVFPTLTMPQQRNTTQKANVTEDMVTLQLKM